ncbi:MAG: polysaccharide deacetylase family protein [Verrucomicrobiales bacterium]|nr:polysaccharide deacetylase family protein [Verrucomicrobiales bacterium]
MYLSIWFGVILSTQSGCSSLKKHPQQQVAQPQAPGQIQPAFPSRPHPMEPRLNQPSTLPKMPPAGARLSYSSVSTQQPVVAMTFDDGPHPTNTPRLLKILRDRNIKATFFVVGKNAQAYPQIIRQILAEGHEIGNHTWTHGSLTGMSDDQIRSELRRSSDAVFAASGYRPHTIRPPYGAINTRVKQLMYGEFGYPTILWSVDPEDWRRPGVSVVTSRLVNGARPGAILLAHDIHPPTIDAMPGTFDQLLARGYRFVTVSQLMNIEKAQMPLGMLIRPAMPVE